MDQMKPQASMYINKGSSMCQMIQVGLYRGNLSMIQSTVNELFIIH